MEPPDVPAELVSLIFRYAASSSGLRQAVKFRSVCRLVDDVVMCTIERDLLFFVCDLQDIEGRDEDHDSRVLFVARFLERRPYAKKDAYWAGNFSAVLNRILDICGVISASDRIAGFKALLDLIHIRGTRRLTYRGIFTLVTWDVFPLHGERPRVSKADWETEIVPAAIVLNAAQVYDSYLPSPRDFPSEEAPESRPSFQLDSWSSFFGSALYAAVVAGAADIVRRILDHAPHLLLEAALETLNHFEAAVATGRQDIVHLLLQYNPPRDWAMGSIIVSCAGGGQVGSMRALLRYATDRSQQQGPDIVWALREGLRGAYESRNPEMIRAFLDHGAKPGGAGVSILGTTA